MTTTAHIRVGAMRHRATLQQRAETPDGGGGVAISWSTEREFYCEVVPLSGSQRVEGMQRESSTTHRIHARYATDITPEKRILFRSRPFTINHVYSPDERQEFLVIQATEGVAS